MKCGDIYYADLSPVVGSEQGGVRPVLLLQIGVSKILCVPVSSRIKEPNENLKLNVIEGNSSLNNSYTLLEWIQNIDVSKLKEKIGSVTEECLTNIKNNVMELLKIN